MQWNTERVYNWFKVFYDLFSEIAKKTVVWRQFKRDADLIWRFNVILNFGYFVRLFERDGKSRLLKILPRVMAIFEETKVTMN